MEATAIIVKLQTFLETKIAIVTMKLTEQKSNISLNFSELAKYDTELADCLLDTPLDFFEAAKIVLRELNNGQEIKTKLRFYNLPQTQMLTVGKLRHQHLNKFVCVPGLIKRKTPVYHQIVEAKFECGYCGKTMNVLQSGEDFKIPEVCSCGRKSKFKMADKNMIDAIGLSIEELPDMVEGEDTTLRRVNCLCREGLTEDDIEPRIYPGVRVDVIGVYREKLVVNKKGQLSTKLETYIDVNYIKVYDENYSSIKLNKSDIEKIEELSRDAEVVDKMCSELYGHIYGYENIKKAIVLQMAGGIRAGESRGDIHVLLIGDPSGGKSEFLKTTKLYAPKSRYISGKGASGVGLSATVVKDELLGRWAVEAGVLPLTHKGMLLADEFDKIDDYDKEVLHEGLEEQTISVNKAGIQATLKCECSVLAAANPVSGRFNLTDDLFGQFNLKPTLINRFDLVFPIIDVNDEIKDSAISKLILSRYKKDKVEPRKKVDILFYKKFYTYVRNMPCVIGEEVDEFINSSYVQLRKNASIDTKFRSLPITSRQVISIIRLAIASAKINFAKREKLDGFIKVNVEDAKLGWSLVYSNICQICYDSNRDIINIDKWSIGQTPSKKELIYNMRNFIIDADKEVTEDEIFEKFSTIRPTEIVDILEKLCHEGTLFKPRSRIYMATGGR